MAQFEEVQAGVGVREALSKLRQRFSFELIGAQVEDFERIVHTKHLCDMKKTLLLNIVFRQVQVFQSGVFLQ